jgi:hypothetical protein
MKTLTELQIFCEGYRKALITERAFQGNTLASLDDWVVWGGYDINLAGSEFSGHAKSPTDLHIEAYDADWQSHLGDPIFTFTIQGID